VVFTAGFLAIGFGAVVVSVGGAKASVDSVASAASASAAGASGSVVDTGAAASGAGAGAGAGVSATGRSALGASCARSGVEEKASTAAIAVVPKRYVLRVYVIMDDQHAGPPFS
jgi:hypothetical protein